MDIHIAKNTRKSGKHKITKKQGTIYQKKQFDLFLKVFVRLCIAWWVLGLLRFLPDDVAKKVLGMFGL